MAKDIKRMILVTSPYDNLIAFDFRGCLASRDDHKFIIGNGHCPHDEVSTLQVSQSLPPVDVEASAVPCQHSISREGRRSFARKPATQPEDRAMGRRKQHCPKKATEGDDNELEQTQGMYYVYLNHGFVRPFH